MNVKVLLLLTVLLKVCNITCFNIDEENAFIISGDEGSYFGYSIAIIENDR